MDQGRVSENVTEKNKTPEAEKIYRILRIIHIVLALLALILAIALTVMIILLPDLQGQNDQMAKMQASNEALREKNRKLIKKVPESWTVHNGSLYYFSCNAKSWEDAEQSCVSLGSHLTSVTSEDEQEFIYKKANGVRYWIGLNKQKSSDWIWTDGTPYDEKKTDRFWAPDEPNNAGGNERCVHFAKNNVQSWNDNSCPESIMYICKWNCKASAICP